MNTLEQSCNEDTFKKTSVINDDICSKDTTIFSTKTISTFPFSTQPEPQPESKIEPSDISDSSRNNSIIEKDTVIPLGNQHLKNLNYIESEIPIYANLYKIELERNYTLYEYAVNFIYEKDDKYSLSTPFKQRIINTASIKVAQKYKNFIFIGSALFSEKKVEEVIQIPAEYHSVNYIIDIQPTSKTIQMSKDSKAMMDQYNAGKNEIKSIFEIIIKEILRHNPSLIKDANSYFDKSHEK